RIERQVGHLRSLTRRDILREHLDRRLAIGAGPEIRERDPAPVGAEAEECEFGAAESGWRSWIGNDPEVRLPAGRPDPTKPAAVGVDHIDAFLLGRDEKVWRIDREVVGDLEGDLRAVAARADPLEGGRKNGAFADAIRTEDTTEPGSG